MPHTQKKNDFYHEMQFSIWADDKSQSLSLLHNNYASIGQVDAFTSTINVPIARTVILWLTSSTNLVKNVPIHLKNVKNLG